MNDISKAICNTLTEVRKMLDVLPITGKQYRKALVNADDALEIIALQIANKKIIVSESNEEDGE